MNNLTKKGATYAVMLIGTLVLCISCLWTDHGQQERMQFIPATDLHIRYTGRIEYTSQNRIRFAYPGTMIEFSYRGAVCGFTLRHHPVILNNDRYQSNFYALFLDDHPPLVIKIASDTTVYLHHPDTIHTLKLFKRTESFCGIDEFEGFYIGTNDSVCTLAAPPSRKIEFIGNSITCGYGNEDDSTVHTFFGSTENSYLSYASLTGRHCNAQSVLVAFSGKGVHINSDSTQNTTMPKLYDRAIAFDSLSRWNFSGWIADVVVINLGINDFGSGVPATDLFISDYVNFVQKIKKYYPHAHVFLLTGPMEGNAYINPLTNSVEPASVILRHLRSKIVKRLFSLSITSIDTFNLSPMVCAQDFAAAHHPSLKKHRENSEELTQFIKKKMNW
ncbi:MAG: hypothetical protein JW795_12865 [Chitinivibrionales bacterium]|nr:hypothetical protein [Chitinivibrionales bacterium]